MARHRSRLAAVTAALVAAAVVAGSPQPGSGATRTAPDRLVWSGCGDGRECASLVVPASYDDPTGPHLTIGVARIAARDPDHRVGSLFVNPGGPGLSAIDVLAGIASSLPTELRRRFDLVAIDPRGVGRSAPVGCDVRLDPVFDRSFDPPTAPARAALLAALRGVADACAARDGARLGEVSTADSARDMDVVRARLGDARLTYLGFSYGTYLGAVYASLFPSQVRAMVLDGAIDPTTDARGATLAQAGGFEAGLDRFLAWCAGAQACAFGGHGDPGRRYDALRRRIAATPLAVDGDATGDPGTSRELNDTRFDAGVLAQLYLGRAGWPDLAQALADADAGRGGRLLVAADRFLGRRPGGADDGSVEAFWAIGCLDDPTSGAPDLQAAAEAVAPRLGAFVANFGLACAVWPAAASPPAVPHLDGVAPEAIVVGTTDDPATPLVGAERLARVLGDAPLIVARGTRHTAVGSGNGCVDTAVAHYLLAPTARVPARRRC